MKCLYCCLLESTPDVFHNQEVGTMLNKLFVFLIFVFLCAAHTDAQEMQAIRFDGFGSYVQLPSGIFGQEENATIEAWVKWEQFNEWSRVFDFGREGNAVVVQNNKKSSQINFRIWDNKEKEHGVSAKKAVLANTWHHIAVVCGTGGMRIYVDGTFYDDDDYRGGLNQAYGGNYYLGKSNWPKDQPFAGMLSEFRVWNYQRSQSEIRRTMKVALSGSEEGLVGYWPMQEIKDGVSPDLSSGSNHAKIYGSITLANIKAIAPGLVRGAGGQVVAAQMAMGAGNMGGALPRSQSDYLAYTVGEKSEIPLPENIDDIEARYLVSLKWGAYTGPQSRVMVLPIEDVNTEPESVVLKRKSGGKVEDELEITAKSKVSVTEVEALVINAVNQTGRFRLVERQMLNEVFKEQDLGDSGRFAKPSAAKIGNVLGAQYMMKVVVTDYEEDVSTKRDAGAVGILSKAVGLGAVNVTKKESRVGMSFRLIDAETSELLFTKQIETYISESNRVFGGGIGGGGVGAIGVFTRYLKTPLGQAIIAGINKGVYELVKQIGSLPASGRVIKAEGDKVWLNMGKDVVTTGDVLKVKSKGEELIDPDTGISLGSDDTEIGTIRVHQAQEKYSIAYVVSTTGLVKRGDKVVSTVLPPRIEFADRWEEPRRGKF